MAASPQGAWKQQGMMDTFGLGVILDKVIDCAVLDHLHDSVHQFVESTVWTAVPFRVSLHDAEGVNGITSSACHMVIMCIH